MQKLTVVLLLIWCLAFPAVLLGDECMEGDCDNGFGTGFTEDNKIYEGEWKNGVPHGKGKLYVSRNEVIEGVWEKGELVKEERIGEEKQEQDGK